MLLLCSLAGRKPLRTAKINVKYVHSVRTLTRNLVATSLGRTRSFAAWWLVLVFEGRSGAVLVRDNLGIQVRTTDLRMDHIFEMCSDDANVNFERRWEKIS